MRKFVTCLLALCLLLGAAYAVAEEAVYDWMIFRNLTEPAYTAVRNAYTLPTYQGGPIPLDTDITLHTGDTAQVTLDIPEDGLYEIWLTYENLTASMLPTELTIRLDGDISFFELRRIKLESVWIDDGIIPLDRYGNEIAPTAFPQEGPSTKGLTDSAGRTADPFLFSLTAGQHTLDFSCNDGSVAITGIALRAPVAVPAYEHHDAPGDALIIIEAETLAARNHSALRGASEFNASLNPYNSETRVLNHLGDGAFSSAGDSVTYAFDVAEAGYYQMGFYYRQTTKADFPVFVDILLDGQYPSQAARQVRFPYTNKFAAMTVPAGDAPQAFYLEAGRHTLTLTINCEPLTPIYEEIDALLGDINGLALEVVRLTGGDTTDRYRDYSLLTYIPNLQELLYAWADRCDAMLEQIQPYTDKDSKAAFSQIVLCAAQLRRLAKEPEDLPRRLAELNTGATSAARMLAQQLQDMAENDLGIDQIYLYQQAAQLPDKAGALGSLVSGAERFANSFSAQDYSVSHTDDGRLQVWMARSRQYVEILQNMVDSEFTPLTGIEVDLSIMPDAQKLVLANAAGTGPDVVLSVQYVLPSYLNIRGALYDLTRFDDFGEIAQRFPVGMFTPYILEGGVYALPETVNFWVMFYREDIFQALNIPVPDTLDEVKAILPELQRRNMNFFFPTAGMVGMKVFPGTLPLILQNGGSIYGDTVGDTTLDSEASLAGFRELTDLFTIYNMPTDVPAPGFYQQFRDGTLSIGISDLATYNLLLNAAPELEGLWNIAVFPGTKNDEDTIERWTTGGAETMGIFSTTERPDDSWTFLKWWSSADVQARFGSLLQSSYGSEYIWPTANKEAFAQLPLKAAHKEVIMAQMDWMTEAPWVLGTYMLERELSNAFISVVVDGTEARRALDTAVKRINRETYRKLEEFGYYKDGVMLKDFVTPNYSVVEDIIEAYNQRTSGEVNP